MTETKQLLYEIKKKNKLLRYYYPLSICPTSVYQHPLFHKAKSEVFNSQATRSAMSLIIVVHSFSYQSFQMKNALMHVACFMKNEDPSVNSQWG